MSPVGTGTFTRDDRIYASLADLDRLAARKVTPPPACEACTWFVAGSINPTAGVGTCNKGHKAVYPMQRLHCRERKLIKEPKA